MQLAHRRFGPVALGPRCQRVCLVIAKGRCSGTIACWLSSRHSSIASSAFYFEGWKHFREPRDTASNTKVRHLALQRTRLLVGARRDNRT